MDVVWYGNLWGSVVRSMNLGWVKLGVFLCSGRRIYGGNCGLHDGGGTNVSDLFFGGGFCWSLEERISVTGGEGVGTEIGGDVWGGWKGDS